MYRTNTDVHKMSLFIMIRSQKMKYIVNTDDETPHKDLYM